MCLVPPAEYVTLLIDLDILQASNTELIRHILRALGLVKRWSGNFGDENLCGKSLFMRGLDVRKRLPDLRTLQKRVVSERRECGISE